MSSKVNRNSAINEQRKMHNKVLAILVLIVVLLSITLVEINQIKVMLSTEVSSDVLNDHDIDITEYTESGHFHSDGTFHANQKTN